MNKYQTKHKTNNSINKYKTYKHNSIIFNSIIFPCRCYLGSEVVANMILQRPNPCADVYKPGRIFSAATTRVGGVSLRARLEWNRF